MVSGVQNGGVSLSEDEENVDLPVASETNGVVSGSINHQFMSIRQQDKSGFIIDNGFPTKVIVLVGVRLKRCDGTYIPRILLLDTKSLGYSD